MWSEMDFKRYYRGYYRYYMIGLMDSKESFDFEKIFDYWTDYDYVFMGWNGLLLALG